MNRHDLESFDDLDRLLKDLPERRASPGFSKRVLERAEPWVASGNVSGRSGFRFTVPAAVFAGLAFFSLLYYAGYVPNRRDETGPPDRLALHRLMGQTQALKQELAALRGQLPSAVQAVSLGKTGDIEYLIDLDSLVSRSMQPPARPTPQSRTY